jgi:hypothetical protein
MFNLTIRPLLACAALGLLTLTGCEQTDPLTRPYMWHPTDANRQNIAVMAANPADLSRGRGITRNRVRADSEAVEHLWAGKPVPFVGGSGGSPAAAAPAAGGGT